MPRMPSVADDNSGLGALEVMVEQLNSPTFQMTAGAQNGDLDFLSELFNNPALHALVETHDILGDAAFEPISCETTDMMHEVLDDLRLESATNPGARELHKLFSVPNFQALTRAHDDIACKNYEEEIPELDMPIQDFAPGVPPTQDAIRMVGIRKNPDEPLGILVTLSDNHDLVISRIMAGGSVDNQGLLHVGDIIKEINGQEVDDPDQLMDIMRRTSGSLTLKILPSYFDPHQQGQVFLKAHFHYDPRRDNLIPCSTAGLSFKEGDILQVVSMDDANWWQARKVDDNSPSGLIPSQQLEEKRKAFVRPEYDYTHKSLLCGLMTKKKRKMMYHSKLNSEFDRNDVMVYEEVSRLPPFQRKTLVLIGAQGVGRRTLKQRLIKADSARFGTVIPHTSRPKRDNEKDGELYRFIPQEDMEVSIAANKYLEYGEHDGYFYGTKYDSIRRIIRSGKMCILDVGPQALKGIKTPEFKPYVVFIAAPPVDIMRNMHEYARQKRRTDRIKTERDFRNTLDESARIERNHKHFVDLTIVNDNMDDTYNKLRKAIETLSTEPQWVPASWVY